MMILTDLVEQIRVRVGSQSKGDAPGCLFFFRRNTRERTCEQTADRDASVSVFDWRQVASEGQIIERTLSVFFFLILSTKEHENLTHLCDGVIKETRLNSPRGKFETTLRKSKKSMSISLLRIFPMPV